MIRLDDVSKVYKTSTRPALERVSVDVDQGEFVGTVGGQINFSRTWGMVGEVEFIDNANQYKVGVRASF